jgi:hypothetical protein
MKRSPVDGCAVVRCMLGASREGIRFVLWMDECADPQPGHAGHAVQQWHPIARAHRPIWDERTIPSVRSSNVPEPQVERQA